MLTNCVHCVSWLQCLWCLCLRLCVRPVCGAVFTLLRVVYREHPNLSSHCTVSSTPSAPQGYRYCSDLSTLHVLTCCDRLLYCFVCWYSINDYFVRLPRAFNENIIILKHLIASYWIVFWPTDQSWWLSFLLCAQRCLWVLLGTLAPRLERTGPWSVGSTGGQRKTFM